MRVVADKNEEYEVKVQGVDILPYPISRGEETTFSISANNTGTLDFSSFLCSNTSLKIWYYT